VADRQNRRIQVFNSDLVLRAIYDNVGAPWAVCISPGRTSTCSRRIRIPDNNIAALSAVSGEIYKMELDGTVIGKFGKPASSSASSAPCTPSTAAIRRARRSSRSRRGAPRRSSSSRCRTGSTR
jgi:hypothetical protein